MNYFNLRGQWLYKLPDPYRRMAYLPIDASTMADNLGISYRSALRVCCGQRVLKSGELLALQVIHFGLIHDPDFVRAGFYVNDGKLKTTRLDNYELSSGALFEYALLKQQVLYLESELSKAQAKIDELTAPVMPSNVVLFSDFVR